MKRTCYFFPIALLLIYSCAVQKTSKNQPSIGQATADTFLDFGVREFRKIELEEHRFLLQSFYGDGLPNTLKLFRAENDRYICLDSMTFYFHDELLKPDTIHFDQTCNCFITNSEHSGTGVFGESRHFIIIKKDRFIQSFEQIKYLSIVDPERIPQSTFTLNTEVLQFQKGSIQLKATIIQGEIRDDSVKVVENSREIDTIEYRFDSRKSLYFYHDSKLPAYRERWKNGSFL